MDRTLKFQSHFHTLIYINFNMFFTTISIIHKHFHEPNIFKNYFFMARRTCVQPSLLARLAMATSGAPSTCYRSGNSKGRRPSRYHFPENSKILKKISSFFNFFKKFKSYRTLKFQSCFHLSVPFL